jgi:hypothetical protein
VARPGGVWRRCACGCWCSESSLGGRRRRCRDDAGVSGWVVLRKLEGRISARGVAWLLTLNGVLAVAFLIALLGSSDILGIGAILAAVFVGPWVASAVSGVAR